MTFPRSRVVRAHGPDATTAGRAAPLFSLEPSPEARKRIAREELDARAAADHILAQARREAEELLARARDDAARAAEREAREARERAEAEGAARWLALRAEEQARLERDGERVIALAVVLAERLLGAALEVDPRRIADVARVVLAEARGARRVLIEAHPLDVPALRALVSEGGEGGAGATGAGASATGARGGRRGAQAIDVRADEGLARGDLRLQTDGGTIDAKLPLRLERLAAALRDALPG